MIIYYLCIACGDIFASKEKMKSCPQCQSNQILPIGQASENETINNPQALANTIASKLDPN